MATVTLPAYNLTQSTTVEVSQSVLNSLATTYCRNTSDPSAIDFFYGYLALEYRRCYRPFREMA